VAKIDKAKIEKLLGVSGEQEFQDLSLDDLDSFGDDTSIKDMYSDIAKYRRMLRERVTFINDDLTEIVPFTRENLYLMCAYTGSGKSTAAANISYPLWQQKKKIMVISNEESQQDIIFRIACLHLGYNFNDYKKNIMPKVNVTECMAMFKEIAEYVKVVDVNYKNGITSTVEGVKRILNLVADADYSCVMIDYHQLIKKSTSNPNMKTYDALNELRIWFGQYIKRANLPLVVFAQLHSIGKRNNVDLDNRIKHCPDIIEPSTVVIEMIPDFESKTTDFAIKKDRFGMAGKKIKCLFERGRFVEYDELSAQHHTLEDIDSKLSEEEGSVESK